MLPIVLEKQWKGREIRLVTEAGSYAVMRYYLIKPRIYQLQAIVPSSRRDSPLIGMFLDSFDIYLAGGVLGALVQSGESSLALNAGFISATFFGMMIGVLEQFQPFLFPGAEIGLLRQAARNIGRTFLCPPEAL